VVAVIIKSYRADGTPDLTQWKVQCDIPICRRIAAVMGSTEWFIPTNPHMPTYCPDCLEVLAMLLIDFALVCPCGSSEIQLHINNDNHPDSRWPNFADCAGCGLILMINDNPNFPEW
jgi:hypothetical protein